MLSFCFGLVAQLVRALACHARGRGFEPHPSRHSQYASVAQLVEQRTENPRVVGSIPTGGTICGFSSFGRAPPCQGGGGGFEPRNPLHFFVKRVAKAARFLHLRGVHPPITPRVMGFETCLLMSRIASRGKTRLLCSQRETSFAKTVLNCFVRHSPVIRSIFCKACCKSGTFFAFTGRPLAKPKHKAS